MFWQDTFVVYIRRYLPCFFHASESPRLNSFIVGLAAGSISGCTLNVLQAIKFRMWSLDSKRSSFFRTAWHMYREGGVLVFFRGCVSTIARDSVFGVVYETTRNVNILQKINDRYLNGLFGFHMSSHKSVGMKISASKEKASEMTGPTSPVSQTDTRDKKQLSLQKEEEGPRRSETGFLSNMIAATMASIISSPFNYVRSVVYGTPPRAAPLSYKMLHRSFLIQLLYVYRKGESYIEKHTSPNCMKIGYDGRVVPVVHFHSLESSPARLRPILNQFFFSREWILSWTNFHHPMAACQWASSRLNIGWGSIRVGLGMAIGQGTFHLIQDSILKLNHIVH
ncbi:unnamed protein product [Phytomonas sp. Hart1]|nr:unnamed protein product [Phytomonas sp. Hart1]|eukprot:CCW66267.1 unnamed protein product [Phytomonas sp. isolate Hart1]